jgi:Leucine-rich repeat (LRR) protein
MAGFVKKCPCLRPKIQEEIYELDYRHCNLTDVPAQVFNFERTLEELYLDNNQIQDLPRVRCSLCQGEALFVSSSLCHGDTLAPVSVREMLYLLQVVFVTETPRQSLSGRCFIFFK